MSRTPWIPATSAEVRFPVNVVSVWLSWIVVSVPVTGGWDVDGIANPLGSPLPSTAVTWVAKSSPLFCI